MRWLRDEKNLSIEPYRTACGWLYNISNAESGTDLIITVDGGDDSYSGQFTTYEKAVDDAIEIRNYWTIKS